MSQTKLPELGAHSHLWSKLTAGVALSNSTCNQLQRLLELKIPPQRLPLQKATFRRGRRSQNTLPVLLKPLRVRSDQK